MSCFNPKLDSLKKAVFNKKLKDKIFGVTFANAKNRANQKAKNGDAI